jgi:type II secretory pathway component PulC
MKYILTLVFCLGFFSISNSFGQEEAKKVVIVKKTVDENGKTTTERQEASGKEADALIKKMKEDGNLEGIDIEIEMEKAMKSGSTKKETSENITIEKTIENGKEMTMYKIVTEENGEKKVMVWKGDGEMPAEMAEKLKNADIKSEKFNDGKEMRIIVEMDDQDDGTVKERVFTTEKEIVVKEASENKVRLGVMIEDDSEGVVISDIISNSVAEKSGLKNGDIILKINDTYVFNTDMLLKALSPFDSGDKVKVTYLREGKEKKTEAKF